MITMARLLVWIGVISISTVCFAQRIRPPFGLGDAFVADVLSRDAAIFVDELKLDETQQVLFETLFEDYQATFSDRVAEVRQELTALQPDRAEENEARRRLREQARDDMRDVLEEYRQQREQLQPGEDDAELLKQFEERTRAIQEQLRAARQPAQDNETLQQALIDYTLRVEEWKKEKTQLRGHFMTDVKLLLTEDQQKLWPGFERRFRREKSLRDYELSGESVDLFKVIDELDLDQEQQALIAPTMEQYGLQLDAALRDRDETLQTDSQEIVKALDSQDRGQVEKMLERQIKKRVNVRDVNNHFVELLVHALPEETATEFQLAARARGYARIYRTTRAERILDTALELDDLDESTESTLQELHKQHSDEIRRLNEQLKISVEQHEPAQVIERTLRRINWDQSTSTPFTEDPIAQVFYARREYSETILDQLQTILPPEQYEQLPIGSIGPRNRAEDSRGVGQGEGSRGRGAGDGRGGGGINWRDFDFNGDGRLNDEERLAFREHLRSIRPPLRESDESDD